ncbi:paramyosin-like [Bombyx mandarina]|uniref:Paramyosin-like n=1 Tax=Bombyx mandarina TaxID=7092 RepID=A0A6J2KKI1_BOMMA|nr:paramyosin-like [Bombyx mandarina]XP_028040669.1 paramyosin-like [Bombyx mandarina]
MFSKAKRFEPLVTQKNQKKTNVHKKLDSESTKINTKTSSNLCKSRSNTLNSIRPVDGQSQCSSVQSSKSLKFATPKAFKITKAPNSSIKKTLTCPKNKILPQDELVQAQDVEIRNKDQTIFEYNKQIEDYKNEIAQLQKILKELATTFKQSHNNIDFNEIDRKLSKLRIHNTNCHTEHNAVQGTDAEKVSAMINDMRSRITELEKKCEALDNEVYDKQMELSSLEEVITVRDSLCKDLQEKLTSNELTLAETHQRLEMVKGHHALALEANESIRREYKIELEALKTKLDEEKQAIISKCKVDQENLKTKHNALIESLKNQMLKEKCEAVEQLHSQLIIKEQEMKAKLEQIEESASEKLKICEIQFEEQSQSIQEHCLQQEKTIQYLEHEIKELKYTLDFANNQNSDLKQELNNLKNSKDELSTEKFNFIEEIKTLKDELIEKTINYENEKNKLNLAVEKAIKEKNKFETSLSVTRDIVHVLTLRLRESDSELEQLEDQVQMLTSAKEVLENELSTYKNTLNNTVRECDEYKEALVNILKSKAALTKEHTRIMEHNVTLIESLQNVEKEAYRELGTIKNELIEDVELLKKESNSQIKFLREEVEKKRVLCEMATEHAGQATAAAEQSRVLLAQAAADLSRLENENERYQQQIQDQQSLVVELSLLRQENEELTMTVAKQSSIIDKLKKDLEQSQYTPKSPSVLRKSLKVGKENMQTISPLRERNL